jgi:MFS family permease
MNTPTRLFNKNYFLLWQGQTVSRLGSQAFSIALVLWIIEATGSASLMGILLAVSSIPALLLAPVGGALADRKSRRTIIILSDFISGIAVATLAATLWLWPDRTTLSLVALFLTSIILSVVSAFFGPAISAAIPDLVPRQKLAAANSLGQISAQVTLFIGQALGGTLYRILGAPVLFLFNGLTFLFAAGTKVFIRIPQTIPPPGDGGLRTVLVEFRNDLTEGLRYIWQNTGLKALVLISAVSNFFSVPFAVLLAFYVEFHLRAPVDWYGFLLAGFGIGALLGFVAAGVFNFRGTSRAWALIVVMFLDAVLYGLLIFVFRPLPALVLAVLAGATGGYVTVNVTTLVQKSTPQVMRGRVFGLLATMSGAITPIAMGISGIVADLTGKNIALIYGVCALALMLLAALIGLNKEIRAFLATDFDALPAGGPPASQLGTIPEGPEPAASLPELIP